MAAPVTEPVVAAIRPVGQSAGPSTGNTDNAAPQTMMPSEVVEPTRSDTPPQQAATQPGDGTEVHKSEPGTKKKVPFKERVIGAAQKTRGTLLGKPALKEHGNLVLDGKAPPQRPKTIS